jgi:hypothetical protein
LISVIIASISYLAETMWFPGAALNEHFTWEEMEQYNASDHYKYKVCFSQALAVIGLNTFGGFFVFKIDIEINKNMLNGRSFNPSKASRIQMCRWFRYFLP